MGYTHYWTPSKKNIPDAAISVLTEVLGHGQRAGIIAVNGDQALEITPKTIWFNGIGSNAHETFDYAVGGKWSFCKTAMKPYDLYVCAALLVLRYYNEFDFNSDGEFRKGEWADAVKFLLDNAGLFDLDQNLIDSLFRIRTNSDLFEEFPIFLPDPVKKGNGKEGQVVSFVFTLSCSFSLSRDEGETDENLRSRAEQLALEIMSEGEDSLTLTECSVPGMIDK